MNHTIATDVTVPQSTRTLERIEEWAERGMVHVREQQALLKAQGILDDEGNRIAPFVPPANHSGLNHDADR
jgi:hypothetical protein